MKKIALIGAGQLGSRHLQALAKSKIAISIEVVEPDENASELAKKRFEENDNNKNVSGLHFLNTIDELSDNLDLVIIATGSNVRYMITTELLRKKNVKNLILEKVLFQEIEHYYEIEKLLTETKTKCWVNHPRRMFPFYQQLKKDLIGAKQISFTMEGGNWGLACNSLHLIDLFSFLSGEKNIDISTGNLFKQVYESKRNFFIEFNGQLTGKIGPNFFSILSLETITPSIITIVSEKLIVIIDESNGFIRMSSAKNNWKWENIETKIVYYQSELTNLVVENLFTEKNCSLPTYKEAMQLHIPFINALLQFMERLDGKNHKVCPIT